MQIRKVKPVLEPTQEPPVVLRPGRDLRLAADGHVGREAHLGLDSHPHLGSVAEEDAAVVRGAGKHHLADILPDLAKCSDPFSYLFRCYLKCQ